MPTTDAIVTAAVKAGPTENVRARAEQARLAKIWDAVHYNEPNESLDPLIDESQKTPDVRDGIIRVNLDLDFARAELKKDRARVWEVVTGELADLKLAQEELTTASANLQNVQRTEPAAMGESEEGALEGFLKGIGSLSVVLATILGIVVLFRNGLRNGFTLMFYPQRTLTVAILLVITSLYVMAFFLSRRRLKATRILREAKDLAIRAWQQNPALVEARDAVTAAERQIEQRKAALVSQVLQKHFNSRFRTFINDQTSPSYATWLTINSSRGLAEVFDPKSAIDTSARNKLKFMLDNMPGGSIGIAGPRGSGKTTLLRLFCGPKRLLTTLKEKKVLAVLVSAPVAYQPRDFILYLFSTICHDALTAEGEEYARPALEQTEEAAQPTIAPFVNLIRPLPKLCIYLGTSLAIIALLFGFILALVPERPKEQAAATPAATPAQVATASTSPANPQSSPLPSPTPSPASRSVGRFLGDFLKAMGVEPGTLLTWGILLIGFGMLCAAVIGQKPARTLGLTLLEMFKFVPPLYPFVNRRLAPERDQEVREAVVTESSETASVTPRTLKGEARDWLKRIKFQQSYTSGWSGSLKLPVGLEGGVNNAITLAENQLSLPEISHAFTKFVELASQNYQVMIGIDELDKLEADKNAAHKFLNDIKSVFGLEKCFYLISVSENAMSSFERRGLPFRDVFDSSFDDIVYVDYLNFESAQKLLELKVIGRPIPFFGLSYSLSAGLARDLIRNFRTVIELRQSVGRNDLETICKAVVHADLKAKVRATALSAQQVELETEVDVFLEALYKLENVLHDESALYQAAVELVKSNAPPDDANHDKAEETSREKLRDLADEFATYVFFGVTILEFFNNKLTQTALTSPAVGGTLDDLAKARQVLAVNPNTTRSILMSFRQAHRLPNREWPTTNKEPEKKPTGRT